MSGYAQENKNLGLMRKLICALVNNNAPLVFKGGVMYLAVIEKYNIQEIGDRNTLDIDADWIQDNPAMTQIQNVLDVALLQVDSGLRAVAFRQFAAGKSAGFYICRGAERLFKLDIGVHKNNFTSQYIINNKWITGSSEEQMMADKLYVISTNKINRRCKDLFDVYSLSFIPYKYTNIQIYYILAVKGLKLGDFSCLLRADDLLVNSYTKLSGIKSKPDFAELYARVINFATPFIQNSNFTLIWNGNTWKMGAGE